jgi:antitoxin CcdA
MKSSGRVRKVASNLSVRADLVRQARALKLNLSKLLETALEQAIREAERDAWLARNRQAISDYNALVVKRGVFSDSTRR